MTSTSLYRSTSSDTSNPAIGANHITPTPWDARAFGLATFEIQTLSASVLADCLAQPGHYTLKVDPLADKRLLHQFGFYYCDTLIEPYCRSERLIAYVHEQVSVDRSTPLADLLAIGHGAFEHGRFHRDFNLPCDQADDRYDHWLADLHQAGNTLGLYLGSDLAGFFAIMGNRVVLHALSQTHRGKGLAKYFWSAGYRWLAAQGHPELTSSISAANMPVLNLYTSLGFRFRNPVDVYHCLVSEPPTCP